MTDQKPEVRDEWDRLMAVLRRRGAEKTVAAIAPPLEPDSVRAALDTVAGVSVFVYGDLSDWLLCHNGFREGAWTRLFPDLDLLSASQMAGTWQMMLRMKPYAGGPEKRGWPDSAGYVCDNGTGFNGSTPAVVDGELTWDLN